MRITVRRHGTIVIEGDVTITDEEGNPVPRPPTKHPDVIKLCGCGRSARRPFCDGSHKVASS